MVTLGGASLSRAGAANSLSVYNRQPTVYNRRVGLVVEGVMFSPGDYLVRIGRYFDRGARSTPRAQHVSMHARDRLDLSRASSYRRSGE